METTWSNIDKVNKVIGWKPETSFEQMVFNMVGNDIKKLSIAIESY